MEVTNNPRNRFLFQAYTGCRPDAGLRAAGVLTWDFETVAVAEKLKGLGGTPRPRRWPRGRRRTSRKRQARRNNRIFPREDLGFVPLL